MTDELIVHPETAITQYQSTQTNPARVYLAGLSRGSRPTMFSALAIIACYARGITPEDMWGHLDRPQKRIQQETMLDTTPWHALRFQHIQALRTILSDNFAAQTANKMLAALRQVIHTAWNLQLISTDDYMRAVDIKGVPGNLLDQATGRSLTAAENLKLLKTCTTDKRTNVGARDAAIIAIGLGCGLRRAEIAAMETSWIQERTIKVTGKRNKTRIVPMPRGTQEALTDWLNHRGRQEGKVFLQIDKKDRIRDNGMSPQSIQNILTKRAAQAGIQAFTPHDLRRTYATNLFGANIAPPIIQKLMGHALMTTTARYDRSTLAAMEQAAETLNIPYRKR